MGGFVVLVLFGGGILFKLFIKRRVRNFKQFLTPFFVAFVKTLRLIRNRYAFTEFLGLIYVVGKLRVDYFFLELKNLLRLFFS
jgi:hypothetical protein